MTQTLLLTEVPANAGRLKASVNADRLLQEIGAMFGSPAAAMAEMVQNAARAQATQLDVTWDATSRQITFRDNGGGADALDPFIRAAESLWDPARVTDAAGLGCFAMFALCDEILLESRPSSGVTPWRASFKQALLTGEEARHWPAPELADGTTGVTVRGIVRAGVQIPTNREPAWRHRYPVEVTFNGRALPPRELPTRGLTMETPAGTLLLHDSRYGSDLAVWEGRVLELGSKLRNLLTERITAHLTATDAAERAARSLLVQSLRGQTTVVWTINPSCGVRPKLPDRDVLIDDAALREAADVMAAQLAATTSLTAPCAAAQRLLTAPLYTEKAIGEALRGDRDAGAKTIIQAFGPLGTVIAVSSDITAVATMAGLATSTQYVADAFSSYHVEFDEDSPTLPESTAPCYVRAAWTGHELSSAVANALTPALRALPESGAAPSTYPRLTLRVRDLTFVPARNTLVCGRLWLESETGDVLGEVTTPVSLLEDGNTLFFEDITDIFTPDDATAAHAAMVAAGEDDPDTTTIRLLLPGTAETLTATLASRDHGALVWHVLVEAYNDGSLEYDDDARELENVDELVVDFTTPILQATVSERAAQLHQQRLLSEQAADAIYNALAACRDAQAALTRLEKAGGTAPALQQAHATLGAVDALQGMTTAQLMDAP